MDKKDKCGTRKLFRHPNIVGGIKGQNSRWMRHRMSNMRVSKKILTHKMMRILPAEAFRFFKLC